MTFGLARDGQDGHSQIRLTYQIVSKWIMLLLGKKITSTIGRVKIHVSIVYEDGRGEEHTSNEVYLPIWILSIQIPYNWRDDEVRYAVCGGTPPPRMTTRRSHNACC